MALTESSLLNHLRREISPPIYDSFTPDFFTDILYEKTLVEYSTYYPDWIKNVAIKSSNAIPRIDPISGLTNNSSLYKIPNYDPQHVMYLDIDMFRHPCNERNDYAGIGYAGVAENLVFKTLTMFNQTRTLITASFERPDLIYLDPAPESHMDFLVNIKIRTHLSRIPTGMMFLFRDLFICDVKIDIFNELPNLRDSANLGGIEIDSRIGNFESAKDTKKDILEKFEANWFREPENMAPQIIFQKKIF